MILTPEQQDALVEIANIGAGKAAKHLSVLLRDTVQMNVPVVTVGRRHELEKLLGLDSGDMMVGVQQKARGLLDAHVSLLFHSRESHQLVRELISTGLPVMGVDTRALEHDAITEIGNIIVSACVSSIADLLGGSIRLSLPVYKEGKLGDVLRKAAEPDTPQEDLVLLMKTHMRAVRRDVAGSLIVAISQSDLDLLSSHIDQWLASLLSR